MPALLDPWDDAACIAARLAQVNYRLIVLLGAEGWCEKCREFRPVFETMATQASVHDVFLWLDLEGHQEFLGDYIPENLPELLIYRQQKLLKHVVLEDLSMQGLQRALQADTSQIHALPDETGIAQKLSQPNWGQAAD